MHFLLSSSVIISKNNTVYIFYFHFQSSYLKRHLKKDKVITQMSTNGDVIPKAFMQALVMLIGMYPLLFIDVHVPNRES